MKDSANKEEIEELKASIDELSATITAISAEYLTATELINELNGEIVKLEAEQSDAMSKLQVAIAELEDAAQSGNVPENNGSDSLILGIIIGAGMMLAVGLVLVYFTRKENLKKTA